MSKPTGESKPHNQQSWVETLFCLPAPAFAHRQALLPLWLWLVVPLAFYCAVLGSLLISAELHFWVVNDERGLGENLTSFWFLGTSAVALMVFFNRRAFQGHWLRWCFLAIAFVGFFVAGEEASWGQHFLGWGTPDWMADLNKQDETNLHNMAERALDQKPRAIISILIFLGGVLAPLLYKKDKLQFINGSSMIAWLMPTTQLIPAALLTFLPRLPDRIQANLDISLGPLFQMPTRHYQEIQEFFIGLFIFLYVLNLFLRLRKAAQSHLS